MVEGLATKRNSEGFGEFLVALFPEMEGFRIHAEIKMGPYRALWNHQISIHQFWEDLQRILQKSGISTSIEGDCLRGISGEVQFTIGVTDHIFVESQTDSIDLANPLVRWTRCEHDADFSRWIVHAPGHEV